MQASKLLRIITVVAVATTIPAVTGCAWVQAHKSQLAQTAQIVGVRAGKIAATVVLDAAVSSLDREKKLDYLDGLAGAFRSHETELVNAEDIREIVKLWTPDKPHWAELGNQFSQLWAQYNPRSQQEVAEFLEAYAGALNAQRTGTDKARSFTDGKAVAK